MRDKQIANKPAACHIICDDVTCCVCDYGEIITVLHLASHTMCDGCDVAFMSLTFLRCWY